MNINVAESSSLYGKMTAILVVVLLAFSGFTMGASAISDDEQDSEITNGVTLGEAIESESQGVVEAISELNTVSPGQDSVFVMPLEDGKFSPAKQTAGDAKVLIVDDDGENWMSGPWLEASHIATALNDGGYSYDVFRAGRWGGVAKELPSGDAGLSLVDDYEVIIWYGGWNTQIMSSSETSVLSDYLDGENGGADSFSTTNRNIFVSTQMSDWFDANNGNFQNTYMHSDTYYSSYIVVDGTSNPMKGVDGSIFEEKEYATDTAGTHYLDRPCGNKPYDNTATGAFWMDARKNAADGHEYHAVQFPVDGYVGIQTHKAFMFADEIGVFNKRSDRADLFATVLSWMGVTKEQTQNVDIGIGGVDIPNHVQYWRSVEAMVEVEIKITVTNYGMLPQSSTAVALKIKNQFGQVLFDSTFDTRAFTNENHPMHVADSIQNGDSIVFTFNKTNDKLQREYDGLDIADARSVMFTSAGMDSLAAIVKHTGDQGVANNYVQADVGIGKWIENGEAPEDEIGDSITISDTDENGANSLDHINMHRASSYDWDADGCGWYEGAADDCVANGGTLNKTKGGVYHEGKSALAMFADNGWYKTNANPANCDAGSGMKNDADCPKFTMEPNQDDVFTSPMLDLSAMEEVVVGMLFTGCMESGDNFRMQIKKADQTQWTNLISYSGFCPGEGAWYLWGGSNARYQGYALGADWYGDSEDEGTQWRVMADADSDQVTEGSRPYAGWFIDEIVFRGTEKITRDVAISEISVREGANMIEKHAENSLQREINATLMNVGESGWKDLNVQYSVKNLQGQDVSYALDCGENCILGLGAIDGNTVYGDVRQGGGHEHETDLFVLFKTPEANTYTVKVTAIVPPSKDFFPWNNTLTFTFRVFDTFFKDDVDTPADRSSVYSWNKPNRLQGTQNEWKERNIGNDAYSSQYIWQYAKSEGYNKDNPSTAGGGDDSLITQDMYDRDGASTAFDYDLNVDLRAAFKPILSFAIKWDLAGGDRLEVRAATDFDSTQAITSGTWTVLKTYEYDCGCSWTGSDQWVVEELDLEAFEGYQTWIDFRVVTASGGGKGVMLDDILVIGNEYRNNFDITSVVTDRYAASGEEHDLSVTVKGIGLLSQRGVNVYAQILDSNGAKVWPESHQYNFFEVPSNYDPDGNGIFGLEKGQEFTVDPSTAGDDWVWGAGFGPGIYTLRIHALRVDEVEVPDENRANNFKTVTIVLGAALLSGEAENWNLGDGWSAGSYIWDGANDGSLTSESFVVWNSKPFLVVEAEYDLTEAYVKAQVRTGSSGSWFDVKWRAADELSTLYSIPSVNYTALPDRWSGASSFDNATAQTFFADLGAVKEIGDGNGQLQDKYLGGTMSIRLTGTNTGGGGSFTAFYPSVFGLDSYSVDVKSISPSTQNGIPSSLISGDSQRTYTVKINNHGAASDAGVIDFILTAPQNAYVKLDDGTDAKMDSVIQNGKDTRVAIKPIVGGLWNDISRDDPSGGDATAYIFESGSILWPSGIIEAYSAGVSGASTGWDIINPTKSSWNPNTNKPMEPDADDMIAPGSVMTVSVVVTLGYSDWVMPGTWSVQADARSWTDYENTFTSGDSDGQATLVISRPDLSIGEDIRYISHATGWGSSNIGWEKKSGGSGDDADPYFSFMFQVINTGTETVGSFFVGLTNVDGDAYADVQVSIYWTGNAWAIDESKTTAHGAKIVTEGNSKFIYFEAVAAELGMTEGPGDDSHASYPFYLTVDTSDDVSESNEGNNQVPITINAVKEVNTIPSFALSLMSITMSGLLAAIGIALRQKEEE
ncbi:MAG TPA: hypothetical protein EYQ70_02305 [Marine Group III euryarchaeote]|uniref:CARDB domain-containing protein n=1 Tax=Marine Group III euryarchaeote TaxID=2173149 RepID=A0A7J4GRG7_9ARCH|nr:hypothetical protein [Marine Group III euryarchaeote]